jgi:hypothetical protein
VSKAALQCLGQVLSALDPSNWAAALAPFSLLLSFSTDARPKVRRRAQTSLVEVLASIRGGPAAQPAGDALLRLCQRVLPGPEAAARAAATASNKQRSSAEEAITKAVSDALHLLALLKQLLPLTTSECGAGCWQAAGLSCTVLLAAECCCAQCTRCTQVAGCLTLHLSIADQHCVCLVLPLCTSEAMHLHHLSAMVGPAAG